MAARSFTLMSFLWRWVAALCLVLATFNPSGASFYHWIVETGEADLPVKVFAAVAIVIVYIIFLRATWRSIGPIGVALALAFFGALIWMMVYYGLLDPEQTTVFTYVGLVLIATVMAIGLSWSHVRRRLSGQMDMDDVDE
ncbi:MAG: DUF6524 family protein [Paracoccaceae bacterium]|nr:DUF6524 family protein [Paracoccaceae bacterium]